MSMFLIVTYDVEQRRTEKFRKALSAYLEHEQNSVFMGTITPSARRRLLTQLKRLLKPGERLTEVAAANRNNVEITRVEKEAKAGPARETGSSRHRSDHRVI
jgi:CRISPR-associated protein Cas2